MCPLVAINSFHALAFWSTRRKPRGDGRKKKSLLRKMLFPASRRMPWDSLHFFTCPLVQPLWAMFCIWKYTLPCIWTACATLLDVTCMVATTRCLWNWCRMVWEQLELVTIPWRCVLCACKCFFRQLDGEGECFWNWNSFATRFSGVQMNLEMILVWTTFWTRSTLFFKHMCMRFQQQPWLDFFSAWCVLFSEAANYFCQQFGCFWNLFKWCVWRELGNGDDLFLRRWWIHH